MTDNQAVIVYGAGISGRGAAEVLAKAGQQVFLYNDSPCTVDPALEDLLRQAGGRPVCGDFTQLLAQARQLVLSPGVWADNPNVLLAEQSGLEVISEIELAYRLYKGHLVGITGTNGKTTTTTLVGQMLACLPVTTGVGGNIGLAMSKEVAQLDERSWFAAELSSFQLEKVQSFAPDVAAVLNLTPDHLDRHQTLANYYGAKRRLLQQQTGDQVAVLNYDDPLVREWGRDCSAQVCYFSRTQELEQGCFIRNGVFTLKWGAVEADICAVDEVHIFGGHNEENVLAAIGCGYFAGVPVEAMAQVLRNFKAVEHRLEYVATIDGVPYYNDSKATNTDAAVKALQAFKQGHVILLAGGFDKLTELETMMAVVKEKADVLILLGAAKERFYQAAVAAGVKEIHLVDSFEEAVALAHALARAPQVVLLSPACSSFDMFKNYPARGRRFKELVHQLESRA